MKELIPKQKVLVQVMKEPTGTKGPRLTGNIALPGRYLVLQPYGQGVNISRRIKELKMNSFVIGKVKNKKEESSVIFV